LDTLPLSLNTADSVLSLRGHLELDFLKEAVSELHLFSITSPLSGHLASEIIAFLFLQSVRTSQVDRGVLGSRA
jgi:hypothetical protein